MIKKMVINCFIRFFSPVFGALSSEKTKKSFSARGNHSTSVFQNISETDPVTANYNPDQHLQSGVFEYQYPFYYSKEESREAFEARCFLSYPANKNSFEPKEEIHINSLVNQKETGVFYKNVLNLFEIIQNQEMMLNYSKNEKGDDEHNLKIHDFNITQVEKNYNYLIALGNKNEDSGAHNFSDQSPIQIPAPYFQQFSPINKPNSCISAGNSILGSSPLHIPKEIAHIIKNQYKNASAESLIPEENSNEMPTFINSDILANTLSIPKEIKPILSDAEASEIIAQPGRVYKEKIKKMSIDQILGFDDQKINMIEEVLNNKPILSKIFNMGYFTNMIYTLYRKMLESPIFKYLGKRVYFHDIIAKYLVEKKSDFLFQCVKTKIISPSCIIEITLNIIFTVRDKYNRIYIQDLLFAYKKENYNEYKTFSEVLKKIYTDNKDLNELEKGKMIVENINKIFLLTNNFIKSRFHIINTLCLLAIYRNEISDGLEIRLIRSLKEVFKYEKTYKPCDSRIIRKIKHFIQKFDFDKQKKEAIKIIEELDSFFLGFSEDFTLPKTP